MAIKVMVDDDKDGNSNNHVFITLRKEVKVLGFCWYFELGVTLH